MTNLQELKIAITDVIKDDTFSAESLGKILYPIPLYINNTVFQMNINDIITIITADRDGDTQFTINDISLFSKDIIAMTSFITSLLLILNSIPSMPHEKIQYNQGASEELIFKCIVYIFLVILPSRTKVKFTFEEKMAILNVCLLIYQSLINSQTLKSLIDNVASWFKSKGYCQCFSPKISVIENKMPEVKHELIKSLNDARDKDEIKRGIAELKIKVGNMNNSI